MQNPEVEYQRLPGIDSTTAIDPQLLEWVDGAEFTLPDEGDSSLAERCLRVVGGRVFELFKLVNPGICYEATGPGLPEEEVFIEGGLDQEGRAAALAEAIWRIINTLPEGWPTIDPLTQGLLIVKTNDGITIILPDRAEDAPLV